MSQTSPEIVLKAENVTKKLGKKQVLNGISLEVPSGKIIGITGHNGAGKSVLLRVLSGFIAPDSGTVEIFGKKVPTEAEFAPRTGVLIDSPGFLRRKSALANLRILAEISGGAGDGRIRKVLQIVSLDPADERPVSTYSSGMLQRLYLAQALLEDPALLMLDEPTNMLDVNGQREVYSYLVELNQQGKTILLTSNYPDELKILCDDVWNLENGRISPYAFTESASYALREQKA